MSNEAILVWETEPPIPFTCAVGTGIEKGALLAGADLMTASTSAAADGALAGIAAQEKIANDGKLKIAVYRRGIFKMILSGTCVYGNPLVAADTTTFPNHVKVAAVTSSGAQILGHALEAGGTSETILVDVNIGAGGFHLS